MPSSRKLCTVALWAEAGEVTATVPVGFEPHNVSPRVVTLVTPRTRLMLAGTGSATDTETRTILIAEDGATQPPSGNYCGYTWCDLEGIGLHVWVL